MLKKINANSFSNFKTIMRFERQGVNWKKKDLLTHSMAFSSGLRSLGVKQKALFWMDSNHTMEYITALMGCRLSNVEAISLQEHTK